MYSPSRKVRASVRRTLWAIGLGFLCGLLVIESMVEFGRYSPDQQFSPTRSAGLMLNRSQMVLAKEILLEPTLYPCQSKPDQALPSSSMTYPLYIIVKTRAVASGDYFQRRMFTRTSWGREAHAHGIPVIYAVGRANDDRIQTMLENEHRHYGDLLQFNYIDAYYNITIKSAGILHWFSKHRCHLSTPYLFIVDDDVLINIPVLSRMISTNSFQPNTMYGLYLTDIEPHPSGKWAVSLADYPNRTYPAFITGASTLYPSNVIDKLREKLFYWVERNESTLFLDDVLIAGILAEQLGIARAPMLGIEDCSYTDLFSRTIISECSNARRIYVWSKFILTRLGETTLNIDRLIEKTVYLKWHGDFKHTRNGTAILPVTPFDQSVRTISSYYHAHLPLMILFLFLILFISIFIPKFLVYRASATSQCSTSTGSTSSMLLAPVTGKRFDSNRLLLFNNSPSSK